MTRPIITDGAPLAPVAKCVALPAEKLQARTRHFRLLKQRDLYPTFVGFIEAALGAEVPPAEALEDIEVSLAALTQAQAESSARAGIAAARGQIHYQPSTLQPATACEVWADDLPDGHMATFRLQDVTCESCLDAVTNPPVLAARETR